MAQVDNQSPFEVMVAPFIDPQGCTVAVVIVKGTFVFGPDGRVDLADQQLPILLSDQLESDDGTVTNAASDYVDYKPACDVIIERPRNWPDHPCYGRPFGMRIGSVHFEKEAIADWPFGPVPRSDPKRMRHAGTYDAEWQSDRMPLLPIDFDSRFHQAAPTDQILDGFPVGNEWVRVTDWYFGGGDLAFRLPNQAIVVAGNVLNRYFVESARLDTMLVVLDSPVFSLTWRYVAPVRRKFEELVNVFVYRVRTETVADLLDEGR